MKHVLVGVCGGIAAYKACQVVSSLKKRGYGVRVMMTRNATQFVTPLTFETLSKQQVTVETFDDARAFDVHHVSYAKEADAVLVLPATQNVLAKLAAGVADDFLTTTVSACTAPLFLCPAMNTNMYLNPATQAALETLKARGAHVIAPQEGPLACGDVGVGRLAEPEEIVAQVDALLTPVADFRGLHVLVTAGATEEPVDGVRFLTNRSSGKMGVALAAAALERGATVTLIAGRMRVEAPEGALRVDVDTTMQMYDAVLQHMQQADVVIMAAAPADYRPAQPLPGKLKDETVTLHLVKNPDIAAEVGRRKGTRKLVVFAAETEHTLPNALQKLQKKNADLAVANDVTQPGAGFDVDTNIATLCFRSGAVTALEQMSKSALADRILDAVKEL